VLSGVGSSNCHAINVDEDKAQDGSGSEDIRQDPNFDGGSVSEDNEECASDEYAEVEVSKMWPSEFHAVDIIEGFEFIDQMVVPGTTIEDAFSFQFGGICYVKTTYNDHLRRWQSSSQSAKDKVLTADHTRKGLWSNFMAKNPAPYAARKAAKKRLKNAEKDVERSVSS
jgi:hypothetical protein